MDDSNLFIKKTEELYDRFLSSYTLQSGDFLTPDQQSRLIPFLKGLPRGCAFLYGGYEDAERRLPVFVPDYIGAETDGELDAFFREEPDECPLAILSLAVGRHGIAVPGHRDYLGALMAEGIKREKVGDIIVSEGGAQILVSKELAAYLCDRVTSVGRAQVDAAVLPISNISPNDVKKEDAEYNVPSPRLDNVVSSVFGISRKAAVEAIGRGLVFLDGVECLKPDCQLKPDRVLVLRGRGKAVYRGITGTSKKGKSYIKVTKYI